MSVKQVILVRKDLDMPPGKLAAQVAHASLAAYRYALMSDCDEVVYQWLNSGSTKVVLEVCNLQELHMMIDAASMKYKLITSMIEDEGRTVFNEPTITCGAIGPADSDVINLITGGLLLYK